MMKRITIGMDMGDRRLSFCIPDSVELGLKLADRGGKNVKRLLCLESSTTSALQIELFLKRDRL
jgi:hypothetical protein